MKIGDELWFVEHRIHFEEKEDFPYHHVEYVVRECKVTKMEDLGDPEYDWCVLKTIDDDYPDMFTATISRVGRYGAFYTARDAALQAQEQTASAEAWSRDGKPFRRSWEKYL